MSFRRVSIALLALLVAVAAASSLAQSDAEPSPVGPERQAELYVIPPGAEPLFAEMLGKDQTLPGGCTLGNGEIERIAVLATYDCQGTKVVVEISHPGLAPATWTRTKQFALGIKSGTAPDGLVAAIADRIRAREGAFEWKAVGAAVTETKTRLVIPIAGGILVAGLLIWAVRRFGSKR